MQAYIDHYVDMYSCKNCGFEFDENENICPECNTELLAENEEIEEVIEEEISEDNTSDNTPADDSKASKAISNGVTVICIIMVILLALGLFYVIFIDNSNVALRKFFKGIEKEDNKALVSSLSDLCYLYLIWHLINLFQPFLII